MINMLMTAPMVVIEVIVVNLPSMHIAVSGGRCKHVGMGHAVYQTQRLREHQSSSQATYQQLFEAEQRNYQNATIKTQSSICNDQTRSPRP